MNTTLTDMIEMTGIAASPGVAFGRVHILERTRLQGDQYHIASENVSAELRRFDRALRVSRKQMQKLFKRLESKGAGSEHTFILDAHLLMLQDPELIEGVRRQISEQCINAEWAVRCFLDDLKKQLSQIDNEYLQERVTDIDHIGQRILRNLLRRREQSVRNVPKHSVIIAHDLSPADTVHMVKGNVCGFVTELGGRTSHVAIVARSMMLPAMVGVEGILRYVASGDTIILDGDLGLLIVRPIEEVVRRYRIRRRRLQRQQKMLAEHRTLPAITADHVAVKIAANIEKLDEVDALSEYGVEGIGLFRTEYLFMDRDQLPDEEEQFQAYRTLVEKMAPHPVVIRTLDIGADKRLLGEPSYAKDKQLSPALGLRGIRYCLRHPELFEPQLRAILRCAHYGPAKILIPMVTGLEEIRSVKAIIQRCGHDLVSSGHNIPAQIPLGVMIETPAAALIADHMAKEVDFFSIGTNDLIHYAIAADRLDERIAYLYEPLHPAVLRLLREIIRAGQSAGIEVSLCGEVAGEPLYTLILLGLGLRHFSMSPVAIPAVKDIIRRTTVETASKLVAEALNKSSGGEIHDWLIEQLRELFPATF